MNSLIKVHSGKLIDLSKPETAEVDIKDIAHHLSILNRWTGASEVPFSVGQHSIVGSILAEKIYPHFKGQLHRSFMLHDAAEAYLGDVSTPLKSLLPEYTSLENRWHRRIEDVFMIPLGGTWEKKIDLRMLATEDRYYMREGGQYSEPAFTYTEFHEACNGRSLIETGEVWTWLWTPWSPKKTEELFLSRLRKLHII